MAAYNQIITTKIQSKRSIVTIVTIVAIVTIHNNNNDKI